MGKPTIERSDHTILIDPTWVGMLALFQFESHPVLCPLERMELPVTYCLCYGSVAGQSAGCA